MRAAGERERKNHVKICYKNKKTVEWEKTVHKRRKTVLSHINVEHQIFSYRIYLNQEM